MTTAKATTLRELFRTSSWRIFAYSLVLIIPLVMAILTIAFSQSEHRNLSLLTQQLVAVIKPKIQMGDEIEIRGLLSKTVETSDILAIAIEGESIRPLIFSELEEVDFQKLKETGYLDIFLSPYVIQESSYTVFPNRPELFKVKVAFPNTIREQVVEYTFFTTLVISILLFLVLYFRLKMVMTTIRRPIENLRDYIETFDQTLSERNLESERLIETRDIREKFDSLQKRLVKQQTALLNKSVEEERGKLAAQVAHDLKSYTSILLRSIQNLRSKLGEEDLLILQKAASDISIKMQQLQKVGAESLDEGDRSFVLQLDSLIANLVELKAIEYSHLKQLDIRFDFDRSDHGLFVKVDPIELGTAVSNLVNNAVEAIEDSGTITLSVKREGELAVLSIQDTGCGIPENLLKEVMASGFSTKGGVGRGKGLTKAVEIVQNENGTLSIDSKLGVGTTINLKFLEQPPRPSFVEKICLAGVNRVFIVENDYEFAKRVENTIRNQNGQFEISIYHDFESFKSAAKKLKFSDCDLILMDYDLGDAKLTGLDLIEGFDLKTRALLLTHNYSNSRLLDECDRKEIKLLPKILLDRIDISTDMDHLSTLYSGVVVDDDDLHVVHLRKMAREKGLNLLFCRSFSELKARVSVLNKDQIVVMDSRLGDEKKGEVAARELFDTYGFRRIVLNTAYERDHFQTLYPEGMYWIERIIPKDVNQVMACFESRASAQ